MRNIEDPHDPLECNCASVESASSCQRLRLRNVKHAHSARTVNCAASSCTPFLLSLCLCLALSATTTMAAPQTSCILCNKEDLRAREPTISGSYEEFIFDHQVSREEAIQALRKYNESKTCIRLSLASTRSLSAHSLSLSSFTLTLVAALDRQNSCNGMECSPTVLKYCLGPKFVNDHCWCENQHQEGE